MTRMSVVQRSFTLLLIRSWVGDGELDAGIASNTFTKEEVGVISVDRAVCAHTPGHCAAPTAYAALVGIQLQQSPRGPHPGGTSGGLSPPARRGRVAPSAAHPAGVYGIYGAPGFTLHHLRRYCP